MWWWSWSGKPCKSHELRSGRLLSLKLYELLIPNRQAIAGNLWLTQKWHLETFWSRCWCSSESGKRSHRWIKRKRWESNQWSENTITHCRVGWWNGTRGCERIAKNCYMSWVFNLCIRCLQTFYTKRKSVYVAVVSALRRTFRASHVHYRDVNEKLEKETLMVHYHFEDCQRSRKVLYNASVQV